MVEPSGIGWLRRLSRRTWIAVVAVLVVAGIAAFVALRDPGPPPLSQRDVDARVTVGLNAQDEEEARAPAEATVAYAAIQPSLVLITTRGSNAEGEFGGTGAGVIINATGTVLTALHVVEDADSITVAYTDGTSSPATVAAADPDNDIAALDAQDPPRDGGARRARWRSAGRHAGLRRRASARAAADPSRRASCPHWTATSASTEAAASRT